MPKGHKSKAKCSMLRKPECLSHSDECVWCQGKGRCFVAAYASYRSCHKGQDKQSQATRPIPVPPETRNPILDSSQEQEVSQTSNVLDGIVRKLCRTVYNVPPTHHWINTHSSLLKAFIKVHFLKHYTPEVLQVYDGVMKELSAIEKYRGMSLANIAYSYGFEVMDAIITL